jgi:hypothetical protein
MTKELVFDSRQGQDILFSMTSRQVVGPTQPLIQWAQVAVFLGVKLLGYEAGHISI